MKIILFILIFLINFVSLSFQNEIYWNETEILIADNGKALDEFGSSVSISNDQKYCVISAYDAQIGNNESQGKVYIFKNNGTNWNKYQNLIANGGEAFDQFGTSVSISNNGNVILIGTPLSQIMNNSDKGKVYVFENNGTYWNQIQILSASDAQDGDRFGSTVSISNDGNYCVIGALNANVGSNFSQGKAYIFQNNGTFWNQKQILIANDGQPNDLFGNSVAISNDSSFVVIGAYQANVGNNSQQGKAYIFQNNGTFWNQTQILFGSDGKATDRFGSCVSISNDSSFIVIGAFFAKVGNNPLQGKAYIFQNNGTFYNQKQILIGNDGKANDLFGKSISISENYLLIGSPYSTVDGNFAQGKVYVFQNDGINWNPFQILIASDGNETSEFGWSVSISGNYSLIGSPGTNVSNNTNQGKAYFFGLYSKPNPTPTPSPSQNSSSGSNPGLIAISIIIPLIFIIFGIFLIVFIKRKINKTDKYQYQKDDQEMIMDNPLFSDEDDEF